MREDYGIEWKLTGVASRRIGWIANPNGLDPSAILGWPMPGAARVGRAEECPRMA